MKLPPQAKRVFKGVIFDTYQWEQEMFDGSKETFEMIKRADTVQIIATRGEKILIGEEEQPMVKRFHSLFGGRLNENETPLECAKRELLEETGFSSNDWELLKTYMPLHKMDWTVYVFVARECKKIKEPALDAGEKIKVKELSWDEFVNAVLSDDFWGTNFALDVAKMKLKGTLDAWKNRILKIDSD